MSALGLRPNAILACTPATDLTDKDGYGVVVSSVSGVPTATISASATTKISGIILQGANTTPACSCVVAVAGYHGTLRVKLGGTVSTGDYIQQNTDGTFVTDAGSGSRVLVGVAFESGVSGDLIEASYFGPCPLS